MATKRYDANDPDADYGDVYDDDAGGRIGEMMAVWMQK
jgi:hypothetical protein